MASPIPPAPGAYAATASPECRSSYAFCHTFTSEEGSGSPSPTPLPYSSIYGLMITTLWPASLNSGVAVSLILVIDDASAISVGGIPSAYDPSTHFSFVPREPMPSPICASKAPSIDDSGPASPEGSLSGDTNLPCIVRKISSGEAPDATSFDAASTTARYPA